MPNHVTNKLIFSADKAEEIFAACCPGGKFDFLTLVPQPARLYQGNLSGEDAQDYEGHNFWGIEEWGFDLFDSSDGPISRIKKRKSQASDMAELHLELKGYVAHPEHDEDVADDEGGKA